MEKDEQAQIIIENLWKLLGDERVSKLSAYEAACRIGASQELAERVSEFWTGPDPLP